MAKYRTFSPPEFLVSNDSLDDVISLLSRKEATLRSFKVKKFGRRILNSDEGFKELERIARITNEILEIESDHLKNLKVVVTRRLTRLPRQAFKLYLLYWSLGFFFLFINSHPGESNPAFWLVQGAILFFFFVPALISRRARLNIEHQCGYTRDERDKGVIFVDQLPCIQFRSYLAHEYAHHVYREIFGFGKERWLKEGWARFLQWKVVCRLYELEDNPAYLYHCLEQIIGELKYASKLMAVMLNCRLPKRIKRIRSIFNPNPLWRALTGTPGFNPHRLIDNAMGAAVFFLSEKRYGEEKTFRIEFLLDEEN